MEKQVIQPSFESGESVRLERGVRHMAGVDVASLRRDLEALGWHVFVLPEGVTDKRSFFQAVRDTIPLDPPLLGDRSWEALSDSLWSGLDSLDAKNVAMLWPGSATMAALARDDFAVATASLGEVAELLSDVEATVGEPTQLMVILT